MLILPLQLVYLVCQLGLLPVLHCGAIQAFQEVATFVHIKCQVVVCNRLDLLDRSDAFFELDLEIALEFGIVRLLLVRWVCGCIVLHILKVVLLLEVLVQAILHLDAAEEALDALPLLLDVKGAELLAPLVRLPFRQMDRHKRGLSLLFTLLDSCHDLEMVLVLVHFELLEVLADLVAFVERQVHRVRHILVVHQPQSIALHFCLLNTYQN